MQQAGAAWWELPAKGRGSWLGRNVPDSLVWRTLRAGRRRGAESRARPDVTRHSGPFSSKPSSLPPRMLDSSLFLGETGEQPAGHVTPPSDSFLTHFPLFHFTITSLAQNLIALLSKPFLTHLPALNSGPFPICVPYCHQLYLEAKLNDLGLKPLLPSLLFGVLDVAFLTVVSWCSPTLTLQALMNICHSFKSKKTLYTSLILLLLFPLPKMPFHLF